jgi:hypothetical protein
VAEFGSKTVMGIIPVGTGSGTASLFRAVVFVQGTSIANNDVLTVTGLTTVQGAFLISSTGVVGAMTFATNIITVTNAGALTWSGLAWGT